MWSWITSLRDALFPPSPELEQVAARYARKPIKYKQKAAAIAAQRTKLLSESGQEDARYAGELARLLPIENAQRDKLTDKRNKLKAAVEKKKVKLDVAWLDAMYPRLDASFLGKTVPTRNEFYFVPRYAIFASDNPVCSLGALLVSEDSRYHRSVRKVDGIPPELVDIVDLSALHDLNDWHYRNHNYSYYNAFSIKTTLTASFRGALSEQSEAMIAQAKEDFDQVFLITQAPKWDCGTNNTSLAPLPIPEGKTVLVLGIAHGAVWLAGQFVPVTEAALLDQALASLS